MSPCCQPSTASHPVKTAYTPSQVKPGTEQGLPGAAITHSLHASTRVVCNAGAAAPVCAPMQYECCRDTGGAHSLSADCWGSGEAGGRGGAKAAPMEAYNKSCAFHVTSTNDLSKGPKIRVLFGKVQRISAPHVTRKGPYGVSPPVSPSGKCDN
eukprot:1144614-Pelagomonas_calceolata.AAC.2